MSHDDGTLPGSYPHSKIYGVHGLKHHLVEMSQMRDGLTREDRATQPMDAGWLSFAISGA